MITGLGFGLEDIGLGLGLIENWPWPHTLLALQGLAHAVLEPIPDRHS